MSTQFTVSNVLGSSSGDFYRNITSWERVVELAEYYWDRRDSGQTGGVRIFARHTSIASFVGAYCRCAPSAWEFNLRSKYGRALQAALRNRIAKSAD